MSLFFKYIIKTNIIILFSPLIIYAQWPPDAAVFPLDVKTHGMGNSTHINNLATTKPFKFKNSDGIVLHGYFTNSKNYIFYF